MSQTSDLEELFLHWLHVLAPDAPEPQRQAFLIPNRKHQVDFYWPMAAHIFDDDLDMYLPRGLVVEIDGLARQAGGGRHMTPGDYFKINMLNLEGYCVLRFLGSMLRDDPYSAIQQVGQALGVDVKELQ